MAASASIELAEILAERTIELCDAAGRLRPVTVRLGVPVRLPEGDYRCPLQVLGLGDDRVRAPWGEDSFVALEYALQMIGQILDHNADRQQLHLAAQRDSGVTAPYCSTWMFRYPAR